MTQRIRKNWKARSKSRHRRIIRNMQKVFWDSDHAHLEVLVVGRAADPAPSITQKPEKRF